MQLTIEGPRIKRHTDGFGQHAWTHPELEKLNQDAEARHVMIRTLGRFELKLDGKDVQSSGKAKHRPLSLLKALVAAGGRQVPDTWLCECLWPDSDGDLGARNLTITLHRLRHALGLNAAIVHHDGKLTLNDTVCYVDVWKFDRLAESALGASPMRTGTKAWEGQLLAAFDLYAGHFLAMEAEEAWMLAPRMRWKTRFERIVAALSSHFQHGRRFDDAVNICQRALEVDPLNEVHYRRLMSCYLELGETAAVARTYADCRDVLAKGLEAQPAVETERIQRMALERGHSSVRRLQAAEPTGCAG